MRRLRLGFILAMCCCTTPLWAANVLVQHRISSGSVSATSRPLQYATSLGSNALLVACAAVFQDTFSASNSTFSDTLGNNWSLAINRGADDVSSLRARIYVAYALSPSGGVNTVTFTPPGSAYISLVILEVSGIVTSAPLDQSASANGHNASALSGTTGVTVQANEGIMACLSYTENNEVSMTEQFPCVFLEEEEDWDVFQPINVCAYAVSSIGAQSAAWTLGGTAFWAGGILTFKDASAVARRSGYVVLME